MRPAKVFIVEVNGAIAARMDPSPHRVKPATNSGMATSGSLCSAA